jgi:pimeloyl-ACP methyl ester carboxylesterase
MVVVTVAGVRSTVRTSGSAQAREAVVFLHGNPGSSEDWSELLAEVGSFARGVAPDMPGYGAADRPKHFDYTIGGYARHFDGVLSALGVERAHLVLHDFGGPWGLRWASENLARVASLTLINVGVLPDYTWHKFARLWRVPLLGELSFATMTRGVFSSLLDRENPKPLPRAFLDRMFTDLNAGTQRAILRLYRATSVREVSSVDLAPKLAGQFPVLVLWGQGDRNLPLRYAARQREFFPGAAVHELSGCGHWPFIDEPEQTAALLMPFLRAASAGAERP